MTSLVNYAGRTLIGVGRELLREPKYVVVKKD